MIKGGDNTLRGLFELERESQCQAMRDSLLILEKNPSDSAQLEKLMRAAHSLKGAAKLVHCQEVVQYAHQLESGVVAAQEENRPFSQVEFDTYFDLVAIISGKPREKEIESKTEAVDLTGQFARVELTVMDSLLRLAGETLVQQNRLQLENSSARELGAFAHKMDGILKAIASGANATVVELSEQARSLLRTYEESVSQAYELSEQNRNRSYHLAQRLYRETLRARMRPLSDLTAPLPAFCRSVSRALGKEVSLILENQDTLIDRDLLKQLEIPFQQILKNAIDHGIETSAVRLELGKAANGTLRIRANQNSNMLTLTISDDGMGIAPEMLRQKIVQRGLATQELAERMNLQELFEFIFLPGFSSREEVTEYSGRGVGLDIVRENIRLLRGTVSVSSIEGRGSEFVITLPVSLSVLKILCFKVGGEVFGVPLVEALGVTKFSKSALTLLYGYPTISWAGSQVPVVSAGMVLGAEAAPEQSDVSAIVLRGPQGPFAMVVDEIIGQEDVVVQPIDRRLQHLPYIAAVATLNRGSVVVVVDSDDIAVAIHRLASRQDNLMPDGTSGDNGKRQQVLIVDDSLTVRELERKLLIEAGYDVTVALDGLDGLQQIALKDFDLLVTDVDMPRMNGFELIESVRANPRYASIPTVVVSYKERPEDKRKGLECGADAYLTKGSFQDDTFIKTVQDLLRR